MPEISIRWLSSEPDINCSTETGFAGGKGAVPILRTLGAVTVGAKAPA